MRYYIEHLPMTIPMGVQSENNAEAVEFDVSDWLARDGSLSFSVWVTRPGETEAYQAANATLKDGILYWWPTSADTATAGEGRVEILAVSANRRMLSGWTATSIRETTTETTTDTPVDQRPWLDQALLASNEAKAAAASAAASADQAEGVVKKEIAALTQDIARNTAPPIIPTATGEVVTVSDSAHRPFAGLRLYGKTTQNGTPTPNSPVPLVNVGAGGSIGVKAMGKNLLNIAAIVPSSTTYNGITITRNGSSFYLTGTATGNAAFKWALDTHIPDGTYWLHAVNIGSNASTSLYFATEDADVGSITLSSNARKAKFTTDKPLQYLKLFIPSGTTVDINMSPMLTVEDTNTWEPYKDGGSLTASTPNGLPGIPVTSGGNYTDKNGQMWLCDEVNFGRGVYVQRVFHKHLIGNENWTVVNNCFKFDDWVALEKVGAKIVESGAMTNYVYRVYSQLEAGEYGVTYAYNWRFRLPDMNPDNHTVEECKAWLASHPIDFYVPMQAPVETPLSTSELAAFRVMTSQYPNTTVYNDAGAGLGVDYIADTRNYIDQRISALLNA